MNFKKLILFYPVIIPKLNFLILNVSFYAFADEFYIIDSDVNQIFHFELAECIKYFS